MNGAQIEAPCVNLSEYNTTIYAEKIYIGFIHLKSLETKVAREISAERSKAGNYKSLDNFLRRVTLGLEQIRILIRIGAFRFTGKTKQQLLWGAMLFFSGSKTRNKTTVDLFDTEPKEFPLPKLERNELDDAYDEMELLGFPLCNPFDLISNDVQRDVYGSNLKNLLKQTVRIIGYCVTTKDTSTAKGELMHFGTFYDRRGDVFDTVHCPDIASRYPFRGRGFYEINGKVVEEFGVFTIEVSSMSKVPMIHKRPEQAMLTIPV